MEATRETGSPVFLSIPEAARLANVSRVHIWRLVRRGEIEAVRVGNDGTGPLRIDRDRFLEWLTGDPERETA